MKGHIGCRVSVEEVDNPPASSCRAPLPAGVQQTPGTTELRMKTQMMMTGIKTSHSLILTLPGKIKKRKHDTLAPALTNTH